MKALSMAKLAVKGGKIVKIRDYKKSLIDAALIWHGATFLNGQELTDSPADKQLRRAVVRYLKSTPSGDEKHG